jgi:uncharacterized GH25 family protein
MKKLPLALLVLSIAVLIPLAVLLVGRGEAPPDAAGPGEVASVPAAPTPASELAKPRQEPAAPETVSALETERVEAPIARDASGKRTWDPADTMWIEGVVRMPKGVPADEKLEIFGRETDLPMGAYEGQLEKGALARAEVGLLGDFRLGLPPPRDGERFWIALQGRYLYAPAVRLESGQRKASFDPELGAWISGRVILPRDATPEQSGLESLDVELEVDPMERIGQRGSGGEIVVWNRRGPVVADGAFELRGVRANHSYDLRLVPERLAALKSAQFRLSPGEHVVQDLALARGATVAGRVVGAAGKGVEGAKLTVSQDPLMFGQGGFEVRKGESGPDGAFELAAVAPGRSDLKIEADGFLEASRALDLTDGRRTGDLVIQLDGGNAISGIVRWEPGRPAAGAQVKVQFDMNQMAGMGAFNAMSGAEGKGETDAEGRFSVTGLGKGPFTVRASALPEGEELERDRDRDAKEWVARADGVKPGTSGLELLLEPPLGIDGVVVDDLGAPLAEFEVLARMSGQGLFGGLGAETRSEEFEDETGRFRLEGLRRGTWEVQARAKGCSLPDPLKVDVPLPEGAQPVRIVVQRAAIASGVVLDPSGSPVDGAEVAVQVTMQEMMRDREQREPAKSGPDGRFELEGVPPGTVSLVAESDGYAPSAPVPIQAEPGAPVEDIVLRLRVGGRILGEIFNKEGLPAAGERILVQTPGGMGQMWASSDGSGQFVLEHVAPGTWQVMAMPSLSGGDGGEGQDFAALFADMRLTMAEVKDGEDVHVSLGAPPKSPVKVRGQVTLGGQGTGGVLVSFIADGGKGMESMRFTSSNAQGRYELRLDAAGSYLVTVQKMAATGGQQQSFDLHVQIPEQPEHRLDIELPLGGISGRVRGPDGQPAAGARISLMVDGPIANGSLTGGHYAELETGEDGHYELDWLDEGTYVVSAGGAPFGGLFGSDAQFGRQVKSGLKLSKGQWLRDVDFKLEGPGAIAGSVHDGAGQAVADAAIFVRDEGGRTVDRFSMVTTDPAGHFTYGGLQPGRYSVSARSSTQVSSGTAQVQVRGGETSQVKLVLEGGTILIVSLSDGEGNAVECEVNVLDADGHQVNGLWSLSELMSIFQEGGFSSKEQRVGPLPPGKYRVIAVSAAGETVEKPVTLSGQPERKLNLRLKE